MKRTNHSYVVARLMLIVLTLAITVFSFASCDSLPPELQGLLGGNPNASCEHEYDNACDTECNECGATRTTEHTYANGVCSACGATDESVPTCQHTTVENCVCKDCNEQLHTNLEFVPATSPECDYRGTMEFYACLDCEKMFLDAEAKNETNKIDIIIPSLGGHKFDDDHDTICNVCDWEREPRHTFDNVCDPDCNVCGTVFDPYHWFFDEREDGTYCLYCGALDHLHVYTDFCDVDCDTCWYERKAPHIDENRNGECDLCGAVTEIVPTCDHTTVENCVCKDCNQPVHIETECMPTMAPSCGDIGIRYDVYMCYDCERAFTDEECKSEVTDLSSVIIPPLGHKIVGGVCERCGSLSGGSGEDGDAENPTPFQLACSQLRSLYRSDNKKPTPSDYELVSKIVVEGEVFAVTWTIANESITITYDADRDVYIVDVPDEVSKNCYYSIEATIYNNETGRSVKYLFIRLLEKNASAHQHPNVENCVCKDCNEAVHNIEFVPAKSPTCTEFGNVAFYICMDCKKLFSDAEAKNEITSSVIISAIGGEHNYVNGTCDKCGSSDHSGGETDGDGETREPL